MKQFITSTLFTATALATQLDTNMPRDNLAEVMSKTQARCCATNYGLPYGGGIGGGA